MSHFNALIGIALSSLLLVGQSAWCADSPEDEPDVPAQAQESKIQKEYPGILIREIKIAATDPDLAESDRRSHWTYYQPGVKHKDQLLVDLPGTHGYATSGSQFDALAATLGYHVLYLTYRSGTALTALKKSDDPDAFLKGRENLIYGTAPVGPFQTNHANSIMNRLVKALTYLNKTYPKEGWDAYLSGGKPVWEKISLSGVSQGGGHAGLLGVQHPVARVIMFGAPKDYSVFFRAPAKWYGIKPQTPITHFFCFTHSGDEGHGCTYKQQIENYAAFHMSPQFPIVDVENEAPPYGHTHLLTAHTPADLPKHNHGMVASNALFKPAWKYLLTEPCP